MNATSRLRNLYTGYARFLAMRSILRMACDMLHPSYGKSYVLSVYRVRNATCTLHQCTFLDAVIHLERREIGARTCFFTPLLLSVSQSVSRSHLFQPPRALCRLGRLFVAPQKYLAKISEAASKYLRGLDRRHP